MRVDVASGDATRLLAIARNVQTLLADASSNETVELWHELISERERVLGIIRKYAASTIGRSGFLSFVAEQRWPESVRRRVAVLSPGDMANPEMALEEGAIGQLEARLVA